MARDESERWEVHDRYGNKIYMTAERWRHAVKSRPWLADYREQALTTLRRGRRKQDALNPRKYKYYWPCAEQLRNERLGRFYLRQEITQ